MWLDTAAAVAFLVAACDSDPRASCILFAYEQIYHNTSPSMMLEVYQTKTSVCLLVKLHRLDDLC